jgi:hypothetical protein
LGMLQQELCLVLYYYRSGLVAAPFSAVVQLDNGVTLRFGLSRNFKRVWSFSTSGINRRVRVATLRIFFFHFILVWTDQAGRGYRFVRIFEYQCNSWCYLFLLLLFLLTVVKYLF